ncbi:MAG TPA: hypothetical protein VGQ76_04915, partial [Thermoanaerobaculia bacterium]|nr:hypothetical protein [Thermoanaerobaculia bacterium]
MLAHKERIVPGRRTASPYKKLLELEGLSPEVRNELVRRILCACATCVSQLKTASDQSARSLEITMQPMPTSNIVNIGDHAITQKARGLHALRKHPLPGLAAPNLYSTFIASRPVSAELRECGLAPDACRAFIRPAPSQPWHGFQESKLYDFRRDDQHSHQTVRAECSAALNSTLEQARILDPYAEVISMEPIEAAYSAVLVLESGVLVIGPAHDGATAGRDSITLLSEPVDRKTLRQAARIRRLEDHAYIEIVYDNPSGSTPPIYAGHAVQCRPGTPIEGGATEFIPAPVVVSEVITPTDDLIAWRELTSNHANQPGLVAWRPGGSLACHAAIHCASNNIPFLTRAARPEIGEAISAADSSERKPWEFDSAEFSRGLTSLRGRADYMQLLFSGIPLFHNFIHLKSDPRWSCWLGTIAASFFRAAAAACFGEMRHIRRYKGGRHARAAMALETTLLEIILTPMDEESRLYME